MILRAAAAQAWLKRCSSSRETRSRDEDDGGNLAAVADGRPRAGPEFVQCVGLDPGPGHIQFQGHARGKQIGALRQVIESVDAFGSHMALRGNLGLCSVEVYPDQYSKLVCSHEYFSLYAGCHNAVVPRTTLDKM